MKVGERLRRARELGGLSIRELAAAAGVSPSTVWRIEAGRMDPTVSTFESLMAYTRPNAPQDEPTREELVSQALGRVIAAAVLRDPDPALEGARARVRAQLRDTTIPSSSARWLRTWQEILDQSLAEVISVLLDSSARGYELRQHVPFTGLVSDEERLAAIRSARDPHRAA